MDVRRKLQERGKCSRYWLAERVKQSISPALIFNHAIEAGVATDDGVANMQAGAKVIVNKVLSNVSQYGLMIDDEGWITQQGGK